jgi:hypothetical protein
MASGSAIIGSMTLTLRFIGSSIPVRTSSGDRISVGPNTIARLFEDIMFYTP